MVYRNILLLCLSLVFIGDAGILLLHASKCYERESDLEDPNEWLGGVGDA